MKRNRINQLARLNNAIPKTNIISMVAFYYHDHHHRHQILQMCQVSVAEILQ